MKLIHLILVCAFVFYGSKAVSKDELVFEEINLPVGNNAFEPSIFGTQNNELIMSWMEEDNGLVSVNAAVLNNGKWSEPSQVSASYDIYVNWADFPSIVSLDDGTIIVHWLEKSGTSAYAYDIRVSLSQDKGASWSSPFQPHLDRTIAQHGFVSILPFKDTFILFWLDARAYEGSLVERGAVEGAIQLRAAVYSKNGVVKPDFFLDLVACSCCKTSATVSEDTAIIAYRDRTATEIRDISIKRMTNGVWSDAKTVHNDGWKIYGCPVNGPSIDAFDETVLAAWFTNANEKPEIKVAISRDGGLTFGRVRKIPSRRPIGHVDIKMLNGQTGIVSWLEWENSKEMLKICKITLNGCMKPQVITVNSPHGSLNFPKISATSSDFFITWTQPLSDGRKTIKMLSAPLGN